MSSRWCIRSDSPFLSHAHVCVPWLSVTAWSLLFSSLLRCCLCVLCLMVLGVPDAIIPEHSQAELGGEVPTYYCDTNGQPGEGEIERERERKRERERPKLKEEALSLSLCFSFTLWFCPWQRAAKVSRLYSCFSMCWESKSWNKLPNSNMHKQGKQKKLSHTHMKTHLLLLSLSGFLIWTTKKKGDWQEELNPVSISLLLHQ